jgi:CheY-like chemotaxis protein
MIMVVDDDDAIRELLRNILEAEGYEVVETKDGLETMEMLVGGERPDLILLDVMMPRMDGWEVSKEIKSNELLKDITVCMLTAKTTTMDALTSLETAMAEWHLNKPISKNVLLDTIKWLLTESK